MRTIIDVPEYSGEHGLRLAWDDDFRVVVRVADGAAVITANPAGLRSLARHLLTLAQDGVPAGHHVHLDESSSLEAGSGELVIERA